MAWMTDRKRTAVDHSFAKIDRKPVIDMEGSALTGRLWLCGNLA
jgi:hypothetical protein